MKLILKSNLLILCLLSACNTTNIISPDSIEEAKKTFTQLDKNKDGFISKTEVEGLVIRFDLGDKNKDGKLTLEEYNEIDHLD